MATIQRFLTALACLLCAGCTIVVLASMEPEQRAALFLVPADRAVIYLYRDESNDDGSPLPVSVDGNPAGATVPSGFLFFEVAPGHHAIDSPATSSERIELETEAGKTYFIGQEVGCAGPQPHLRLHVVNEAEGRARVRALYAGSKFIAQNNDTHGTGSSVVCRGSL